MASTVDLIKERLSISDVVGSYVGLVKAGSSFKAKCPFHNEKTPSFFVSPARGSYYCFGCGVKGDIFTFVQEFEGVDFMGALKILAERSGVSVVFEDKRERSERERLFKLMDEVAGFYETNLKNEKAAQEYLRSRGLKNTSIKSWRLGFAHDEWREAHDFLLKRGFSRAEIAKAGIIKEENGKSYDRFRSRIMFPISDSAGRIVAFSGRIFGREENDKTPKYLNSPETALFSKSRTLFGFDKAKAEIRRLDYAIVVEGQMDLLICHEAGYRNAVAVSGTALTADHLALIKRLTKRVMFVFDADRAGVNASLRSAVLALSSGLDVKVAALPEGTDPAELIKKDPDRWRTCLKDSKHVIDFHLDVVISKKSDERVLLREIREKVLPYVKVLESDIDKEHFLKKIAKVASVSEKAVAADLEKAVRIFEEDDKPPATPDRVREQSSVVSMALGVIAWQKSLGKPTVDVKSFEGRIKEVLGKDRYETFGEKQGPENDDLAFKAEFYYDGKEDLASGLDELILNLEEEIIKDKLASEIQKISLAEKGKDQKALDRAMELSRDLSRKLDEIKNKRYFNNRL